MFFPHCINIDSSDIHETLGRRTFINNCCGATKCPGFEVYADVQVLSNSKDEMVMASLKKATRAAQSQIVTLTPLR